LNDYIIYIYYYKKKEEKLINEIEKFQKYGKNEQTK
jgi:hypothetical protein